MSEVQKERYLSKTSSGPFLPDPVVPWVRSMGPSISKSESLTHCTKLLREVGIGKFTKMSTSPLFFSLSNLFSFYLDLVKHFKVGFSVGHNIGAPLPIHSKSCCLLRRQQVVSIKSAASHNHVKII